MIILKVKVSGVRDVQKKLGRRVTSINVSDLLGDAAEPMLKLSKKLAPVETGALRESLIIDKGRSRKQKADMALGPDKRFSRYGRTPIQYAHFQELGSSRNGARRYLTRALQVEKAKTIKRFANNFHKELNR